MILLETFFTNYDFVSDGNSGSRPTPELHIFIFPASSLGGMVEWGGGRSCLNLLLKSSPRHSIMFWWKGCLLKALWNS